VKEHIALARGNQPDTSSAPRRPLAGLNVSFMRMLSSTDGAREGLEAETLVTISRKYEGGQPRSNFVDPAGKTRDNGD
jgi:hypothetical protein